MRRSHSHAAIPVSDLNLCWSSFCSESVGVEVWSGEEVVRVEGAVLGCTPVLSNVGGRSVGPVALAGHLLLFEEWSLMEVAKEVPEAVQVSRILRLVVLPTCKNLLYQLFRSASV